MGEKNWEEKERDKKRILLAIIQYIPSIFLLLYLYFFQYRFDRNFFPFIDQ